MSSNKLDTPTCVFTLLRRSGYESNAPIATASNRCTIISEYLGREKHSLAFNLVACAQAHLFGASREYLDSGAAINHDKFDCSHFSRRFRYEKPVPRKEHFFRNESSELVDYNG